MTKKKATHSRPDPAVKEALDLMAHNILGGPDGTRPGDLRALTLLPARIRNRETRLAELLTDLEDNGTQRRTLVAVLWDGIREAADVQYKSVSMRQARLYRSKQERMLRELHELLEELMDTAWPWSPEYKAAQSFKEVLDDPNAWAEPRYPKLMPVKYPKRGNPRAKVASTVRANLARSGVTNREVQNDLLTLTGFLPSPR